MTITAAAISPTKPSLTSTVTAAHQPLVHLPEALIATAVVVVDVPAGVVAVEGLGTSYGFTLIYLRAAISSQPFFLVDSRLGKTENWELRAKSWRVLQISVHSSQFSVCVTGHLDYFRDRVNPAICKHYCRRWLLSHWISPLSCELEETILCAKMI
jgi:hypothetical protein